MTWTGKFLYCSLPVPEPLFQRQIMVLSDFRFVEIGRVAFIAYGPDKGKLCTIVDVIDQNRALIDGPCSGVSRKSMNFKTLHLTKLKLTLPRSVRSGILKKAWEKNNITQQWEQATLTDFDRFKLMKAKQARNRLIAVEFGKLRKNARKAPAKPARKRLRKSKK
ncbi:hypothetical protein KUTeg_019951 [Tegillarca granosa]|uniref:Large ribosomal subunit protein eL14 n=1 Tax=Tegillarca granosa TaxID=220873 RepID=A0ABQ9EJH9_TEGGR|nr:hypothetical protein KUTeg_019951 [Tegillarca granosa]